MDNVEKHVDYLLKDERENTSRIVDMGIKGGKRAELICRPLETKAGGTLWGADTGRN